MGNKWEQKMSAGDMTHPLRPLFNPYAYHTMWVNDLDAFGQL